MRKMGNVSIFIVSLLAVAFVVAHGSDESQKIEIFELKKHDITVKLSNWGASIVSLTFPDKHGKVDDITLGYASMEDYKNDTVYFGATVGRVANRIGGAQFTLDGHHYKVVANEKDNMLHGGLKGYGDVIWQVKKYRKHKHSPYIIFAYDSFDGEEGFPGALRVTVTYSLDGTNKLKIRMKAKALNKATPVNLAHHTYWNLGGHASGDILSEEVQLLASHITPVDDELIPTGQITPVKGTPFDFLEPHTIGSTIDQVPNGYDINYALDGEAGKLRKAAVVKDKKSGRVMKLYTDQPGLQFYTGNMLKDIKGRDGVMYGSHAGLCLETQGYPDSVNHANFPSQIIRPGKTYKHVMKYRFSIEDED